MTLKNAGCKKILSQEKSDLQKKGYSDLLEVQGVAIFLFY